MKLLLWLVLGFIVVNWLLRNKKARVTQHATHRADPVAAGKSEAMRQCQHCGVHIPVSEAVILRSGAVFCSDEHRSLHFPS